MKARLLVDVIPYEENARIRAAAMQVADEAGLRPLSALIRVNWVLAALSRADARVARERLEVAQASVEALSDEELADPDAFGIHARLKSHGAKLLLHEAIEDGSASVHSAEAAVKSYSEVCREVVEYDHLRANYQIELADELHALVRFGIDGASTMAWEALEQARTSLDAHICDLCRGYFHQVAADHHLLNASLLRDWSPSSALEEFRRAEREAREGIAFFATSHHPSIQFGETMAKQAAEEIKTMTKPNKIFLSHKGVDKNLARRFRDALRAVNFDPWLDEDALKAGTNLERGLLDGMKQSCAAVFFITPDFVDEKYLATEIDYAIHEQREREDEFKIIALVFPDAQGRTGSVPSLLRRFVWKAPDSELQALIDIIEAVPLTMPTPGWR